MKDLVENCYRWMQVYLVARSSKEGYLKVYTNIDKLTEAQLRRYEKLVNIDLVSDTFINYVLFRFSCLFEVSLAMLGETKLKTEKYNGLSAAEIIHQTISTLAMTGHIVYAPDGACIHTMYNPDELNNIKAFDLYNVDNLKSFSYVLNYLIEDDANYRVYKIVSRLYNWILSIEEFCFDIEYTLLNLNAILNNNITITELNQYFEKMSVTLRDLLEVVKVQFRNSKDYVEHIDMKRLSIRLRKTEQIVELILGDIKKDGVNAKALSLYQQYAEYFNNFISEDMAVKGLCNTITEILRISN